MNTNQVRARPLFEDAGALTLGIRPCHFYFEIPKSRVYSVFTSPFPIVHLDHSPVKHYCDGCGLVRLRGLKLWWATAPTEPETYERYKCYISRD